MTSTNIDAAEAFPTRLLRSLSAFSEGHDVVVGAIAASLETPIDPRAFSIDKIAIVRSCPVRRQIMGATYPSNLIQLVSGDDDYRATRVLIKKKRRRKEGTCLAVRSGQRTSVILNQLHLHHEFVLVPWRDSLDAFTMGLIRNAQLSGSQIIADGISNDHQAITALAMGVELGTVNFVSIPNGVYNAPLQRN